MSWLCRMIGHKWVTKKRYRVDDLRLEEYEIRPACVRCGEPEPGLSGRGESIALDEFTRRTPPESLSGPFAISQAVGAKMVDAAKGVDWPEGVGQ